MRQSPANLHQAYHIRAWIATVRGVPAYAIEQLAGLSACSPLPHDRCVGSFRLYLVRHGQNLANVTREFSYRKVDYSLTDLGREQAEHTARYFRTISTGAVFTSPLKRAVETARPIAGPGGGEPLVVESFREINSGDLEDLPPTDENWQTHDAILDAWMARDFARRFPGGEDFHELTHRIRQGLHHVAESGDGPNRVVVAHGGTILAALHILRPDDDAAAWWAKGIPNCSISEFDVTYARGDFQAEVVRFGDNSHIPGTRPGW